MKKTRVLLADDHRLVAEGLQMVLEQDPSFDVVGVANDGRAAVALCGKLRPDVVIMDAMMPGLNGMEATQQIRAAYPSTRVLALSMHSDHRFVRGMLLAGASGYLIKDCAAEELTRAVHAVVAGRTYLSPTIADLVVEQYRSSLSDESRSPVPALTPRECEVLQLIAEGHASRSIAEVLHISIKTVESHRSQVMRKLGLQSVAELTKYAIRTGLTNLET